MKFEIQRFRGSATGSLDIVAETEEEKSVLAKLSNDLRSLLSGSHYELNDTALGCTGIDNNGKYVKVNHIMYTIKPKE